MTTASATHLVLIPSYNSGPIVLETVRQAREAWEPVWVVVDGSTDGTGARLQAMAAEDAGLTLPYDCRSGTCTTCIQKCLEGEVDQDMAFAIGDEELDQGLRLICIGSPLSDVVLDA